MLSAAGVAVGAIGVAITRDLRAGVPFMLELWTAAGLIRLGGELRWSTVATAAALIVLRRLTNRSLVAR